VDNERYFCELDSLVGKVPSSPAAVMNVGTHMGTGLRRAGKMPQLTADKAEDIVTTLFDVRPK
jgi:hypothetical protein